MIMAFLLKLDNTLLTGILLVKSSKKHKEWKILEFSEKDTLDSLPFTVASGAGVFGENDPACRQGRDRRQRECLLFNYPTIHAKILKCPYDH